ncbi:MAG: lactate dehydrogenase [Pelagibacterium sp. SCN 64-44]|nr:MAG: lactate dehydrogenase [Pelagibacterium sp. SCN 64-44]
MQIGISEADSLVARALQNTGFSAAEARIITDQIIGCELRGASFAGLSRALSIIERTKAGPAPRPMRIERDTPVSAVIDGGDSCGYLVAHEAVRLGIEKAKASGIGAVGAFNTWYSGMYAHYMEIATRAGMVAMAFGSSAPRVAPHGASEGRFGTNPIAFAFPSNDQPIIFDTGTSQIMVAEAVLADRLGEKLRPGVAYDADGHETIDPLAALSGAIKVWGGHRGSGLALVVQMFGIMAGGGLMPEDYRDCGFFFIALRPDLFSDEATFRTRIADYADKVRAARPAEADGRVRMPFDRSAETRRQIMARGTLEVPEALLAQLQEIARG